MSEKKKKFKCSDKCKSFNNGCSNAHYRVGKYCAAFSPPIFPPPQFWNNNPELIKENLELKKKLAGMEKAQEITQLAYNEQKAKLAAAERLYKETLSEKSESERLRELGLNSYSRIEVERDEARRLLAKIEAENDDTRNRLDICKEERDAGAKLLAARQDKINQLENLNFELKNKVENQTEIKDLRDQVAEFQQELVAANAKIKRLKFQIEMGIDTELYIVKAVSCEVKDRISKLLTYIIESERK